MVNPKTSDALFGALHPDTRITDVSGLADGSFSFQIDGRFYCHVTCEPVRVENHLDEEGEWTLKARALQEGPGVEVHRAPKGECLNESMALYGFILGRWQATLAGQRPRWRQLPAMSSGRLSLGVAILALGVGAGAWIERPAGLPGGTMVSLQSGVDSVLEQLSALNQDLAEKVSEVAPAQAVEVKPLAEPKAPPQFLSGLAQYQATPEIIEDAPVEEELEPDVIIEEVTSPPLQADVEPEDLPLPLPPEAAPEVASNDAKGPVDLLSAFGVPDPRVDAKVDVEARLREEWRSKRKAGIAPIPEPGTRAAQGRISPLQLGGGSMESIEEVVDFGLKP